MSSAAPIEAPIDAVRKTVDERGFTPARIERTNPA